MTKPSFKCTIYIIIAALTALTTDISHFQNFNEIAPIKWVGLLANVALQSLIALRAFMDQSISTHTQETNSPEQIV